MPKKTLTNESFYEFDYLFYAIKSVPCYIGKCHLNPNYKYFKIIAKVIRNKINNNKIIIDIGYFKVC